MPTNGISPIPGIYLTYEDVNILLYWQKLWLDYVQWMRNHLLGALENIPGQSAVETELFLEQPAVIYSELRKYIGDEEAQQYLNVVSRFTAENWNLTNAYKNNDKIAIDLITSQWLKAADELAAFYAKNFKHLDETQWSNLVYEYLNLRIKEINALIVGDYDLEIKIYNQLENKAIELANNIAISIIEMQHQKNESTELEMISSAISSGLFPSV